MKKITLYLLCIILPAGLLAQWQPLPISGSTADVSSMFNFGDELMVGTLGDGIFKTTDQGANWTNISGDLANLVVNDIRGGAGQTIIWAATQNGAYFTTDHQTYINCTNPALSNNEVHYFWFGDSNSTFAEWAIGTNGGGVFTAPDIAGPWTASNAGLSGEALVINDITGYTDDEVNVAVAATNNGVYISTDTLVTWTAKNNGLSGASLQVNRVAALGTVILAATNGGFYYSLDLGNNWTAIIAAEKINSMLIQPSAGGVSIFVVGENAYYSPDFSNFYQLNLSGLNGEITCVAQNSTYVFLGTASSEKEPGKSGGLFRKPIDQLITGVADYSLARHQATLLQCSPNPGRVFTEITFTLEQASTASLWVTDTGGNRIKTLDLGWLHPGLHRYRLPVHDLFPGMYFFTLRANGVPANTLKMIVN